MKGASIASVTSFWGWAGKHVTVLGTLHLLTASFYRQPAQLRGNASVHKNSFHTCQHFFRDFIATAERLVVFFVVKRSLRSVANAGLASSGWRSAFQEGARIIHPGSLISHRKMH